MCWVEEEENTEGKRIGNLIVVFNQRTIVIKDEHAAILRAHLAHYQGSK